MKILVPKGTAAAAQGGIGGLPPQQTLPIGSHPGMLQAMQQAVA